MKTVGIVIMGVAVGVIVYWLTKNRGCCGGAAAAAAGDGELTNAAPLRSSSAFGGAEFVPPGRC